MYCQIALLSPPYSTLTYLTPHYLPNFTWEIGMRVAIPLGNSTFRVGVICKIDEEAPKDMPAHIAVREFVWPMERRSLLSIEYMDMIKQLALRQLVSIGRILGNILPAGMRTTKNIRIRYFQNTGKPRLYKLRDIGTLARQELQELGTAYLTEKADILALAEDSALSESVILNVDPPWQIRANAVKQREILDFLMDNGSISRRQFAQKMPEHTTALNTLVKNNFVKIQALDEVEIEDISEGVENFLPPPMPLFCLNDDQQKIYDALHPYLTMQEGDALSFFDEDITTVHRCESKNVQFKGVSPFCADSERQTLSGQNTLLTQNKFHATLLYGVTGSGKTALYLELAKYCMEQGRSVLLLAPEVAIALKLRQDARARNMPVSLYHGYQSQKSRENLFRECAKEIQPRLIVGTRSALFLPLQNLGLIILDEEHDDSFKQDEGLPYHAKDIAWYRMQKSKGLFLMGSATPDIKSFYASETKAYPRMEMRNRIGNAILPRIELVNIKECKESIAPQSVIALKECISRGDQAIIMLNRRGYAPLLYCLDCNTVARCPHCDIALAYHKKRGHMTCHYCGYSRPYPSPCSHCKSLHFLPMGEGTERLEEDLQNIFTNEEKIDTKVLRLDRDSTRREGRMEEILNAFAKQEAQILVGTQMLSKGHHFPNVTLALIADADLGLNFPDYRAAERTFQLLTQASGRAGRGEKRGSVIIQTRDTEHYCWDFIKKGDFDAFYAHEIALREKRLYPPFVRLALVRASYPYIVSKGEGASKNVRPHKNQSSQEAQGLWVEFVKSLKRLGIEHGIKIMGPSPAPLALLKGRFRFQCLIKGQNWNAIRQIYQSALPKDTLLKKSDLRIQLDIDPVNML